MTDRSQYPPYYFDSPAHSASAPAKADPTFAWVIACVPLLGLAVDYVVPNVSVGAIALVLCGLNGVLAYLDAQRLKATGTHVYWQWAVVLAPAYLIMRTARAKSTPAIPVVWCVAVIAYAVGYTAFGPVTMDVGRVESLVARGIHQQVGSNVDVTCPANEAVRVNESFTCGVVEQRTGQRAHVLITVTAHDGTFRWQMIP